jgi:hypothetical protein
LYLSFILVTWSLLQLSLTDFFENNDNILMKIPSIYAQDDDGGKAVNGNGYSDSGDSNGEVSDDNGDSDVEEPSLDKEDSQEKDVGQEDAPEELILRVDGQDESVDVSRLVGSVPSGIDITSQLPSGDPQPLFVSLPPLPGGPLPPGSLHQYLEAHYYLAVQYHQEEAQHHLKTYHHYLETYHHMMATMTMMTMRMKMMIGRMKMMMGRRKMKMKTIMTKITISNLQLIFVLLYRRNS